MKRIVVALSLAGFTAFAMGCSAGATEDDATDEGARADEVVASGSARVETITLDESKPATDLSYSEYMTTCTLTGHYVKVSGLAPAVEAAINDALMPEELKELQAGCEQAFDVNTSTEVLFNDKGVLSTEHGTESYYAGAAHPNHALYVRSFSLKTGKQLEIADVFSDATGQQLAHEVLAALESGTEEQREIAEFEGETILEHPEWMSFALTKDSVRIYLTPYMSHAAFALAVEPLELRYSDLRDALSGTSEVAAVWANAR